MLAIAPGWELEVERGPDWLLVRVISPDGNDLEPPPLAERVWALLRQHFTYRLVLELDQVAVLNSHVIGQLVSLYRLICKHDGVMRLCGLSPYNRWVLHTCHLDDRFLPYRDRREAVMGCHGPRRPK
jgi:anti-anti-sigma regulatory factor